MLVFLAWHEIWACWHSCVTLLSYITNENTRFNLAYVRLNFIQLPTSSIYVILTRILHHVKNEIPSLSFSSSRCLYICLLTHLNRVHIYIPGLATDSLWGANLHLVSFFKSTCRCNWLFWNSGAKSTAKSVLVIYGGNYMLHMFYTFRVTCEARICIWWLGLYLSFQPADAPGLSETSA